MFILYNNIFQLKKKIYKHELKLEYNVTNHGLRRLSNEEIKKSRKVLRNFEEYEELRAINAASKNQMEAFIYKLNEYKGEEQYEPHSTEAERLNVTQLQEENDDWLYTSEGSNSNYTEYDRRYNQMVSAFAPIGRRIYQTLNRPEATKIFQEFLFKTQNRTNNLQLTLNWITDENKTKLNQLLSDNQQWIDEAVELQKERPLNEEPVYTIEELDARGKKIQKEFETVRSIKKPKNATETNGKAKKQNKINLDDLKDKFNAENMDFSNLDLEGIKEKLKKQQEEQEEQDEQQNEEQQHEEQQDEQQEQQDEQQDQQDQQEQQQEQQNNESEPNTDL